MKRYDFIANRGRGSVLYTKSIENDMGEFVKYKDVKKLEKQNEQLEKDYYALEKEILKSDKIVFDLKKQNEELIQCLMYEIVQSQQDTGSYSLKSAKLLEKIKQKPIEEIIQ